MPYSTDDRFSAKHRLSDFLVVLKLSVDFADWPVTNTVSGITYRNVDCFICNDDRVLSGLSNLNFWRKEVVCNVKSTEALRWSNVTLLKIHVALNSGYNILFTCTDEVCWEIHVAAA